MTAPDGTPPGGRRLFRPEGRAGGTDTRPRGELPEAGVYTPLPRRPLRQAVRDALGDPTRDGAAAGLDLAPVRARPDLHRRLVDLLAGDAALAGAERIVAAGDGALALAAPVAVRLGVPLGRRGADDRTEAGSSGGSPSPGAGGGRRASTYLVACVLHDEDLAGPGLADRRGAGGSSEEVLAGAGTVVRIRGSDPAGMDSPNVLSVIEL